MYDDMFNNSSLTLSSFPMETIFTQLLVFKKDSIVVDNCSLLLTHEAFLYSVTKNLNNTS